MSRPCLIAPARDAEARACRMLLPAAYHQAAPDVLLARAGDGAICGAAAIQWAASGSPPGLTVLVHVVATARRRGVGRALLEAASARAAGEGLGLWSWDVHAEDDPAACFLSACGFVPRRRIRHYRAEVARTAAVASAVTARLRARGRIPARAEVVTLREADPDAVMRLVVRELGSAPAELRARLSGGANEFELDGSVVLLVDGRVAGAVLMRLEPGEPVTDAIAVAPEFRGDWAYALLLEAITVMGRAAAVTHFRFLAEQTVRDTVKLAVRSGAEVIDERAGYYLPPAA